MKPKLLLRIAAGLMLFHAIGHTLGALGSNKAPNARVAAVINSMQTEHFNFMGRSATIGQFYDGYGISMIFALLLISILLWLLGTRPIRIMVWSVGLFLLAQGIDEYIYFFTFASIVSLLAATLTLISAILISPQSATRSIPPNPPLKDSYL